MLAFYSSEMTAATENYLLGSVQLYKNFFPVITSCAYGSLLRVKFKLVNPFFHSFLAWLYLVRNSWGPWGMKLSSLGK